MAIHKPPKTVAMRADTGAAGIDATAEGRPAPASATAMTSPMPHPIASSAGASSPNGIARSATIPQGMIQNAVAGTATKLATRPKTAMRLKCQAENGAVARLATMVVAATAPR